MLYVTHRGCSEPHYFQNAAARRPQELQRVMGIAMDKREKVLALYRRLPPRQKAVIEIVAEALAAAHQSDEESDLPGFRSVRPGSQPVDPPRSGHRQRP